MYICTYTCSYIPISAQKVTTPSLMVGITQQYDPGGLTPLPRYPSRTTWPLRFRKRLKGLFPMLRSSLPLGRSQSASITPLQQVIKSVWQMSLLSSVLILIILISVLLLMIAFPWDRYTDSVPGGWDDMRMGYNHCWNSQVGASPGGHSPSTHILVSSPCSECRGSQE